MATTITAGNATNGAAITSDNTGILELKTGTGAGTTAVTVGATQNVTFAGNVTVTGTITAGAGTPYVLNVYATPGSYTKPAGLKLIKVTVVGGGARGATTSTAAGGSGGGAGGAVIKTYPAPSLPASAIPYTVGAGGTPSPSTGGTTSFGVAPLTVLTATGGSTGASQSSGGAGGTGSGGDINIEGGAGAQVATTGQNPGATGGNSIFGGGNRGSGAAAATTYGAGGGGGTATGQGAPTGTNGGPGVVIIEEFY